MADKILKFNGKAISGPSGTGLVILDIPELPEPASMTLRFQFSDKSYDPTSVTSKGTWTKLPHPFNNIWDWTYDNPDWGNAFLNVFKYKTNMVDIIAAGDTSKVTSVYQLFNNSLPDSDPNPESYIHTCCLFDTSNVTNMQSMFKANHNLVAIPQFDTSSVTNMCQMFRYCSGLTTIPLLDTSNVTNMDSTFRSCSMLSTIPLLDTSKVTNMLTMFAYCDNLITIPALDTSNVTTMYGMFYACKELESVPALDYGKVTELTQFIGGNNSSLVSTKLETIPDMSTVTSALTDCTRAFKNIRNAKYGILEAYNYLNAANPTTYTDCFTNCGINTLEGHYQLNQIPTSWGGLQDPNHTVTIYGRTYRTVTIGNTEWMAENLEADFPNGINPYYNNDPSMKDKGYGRLYSWETIINNHRHEINSNIPEGWRLPTTAEINELVAYFGNNASTYSNARSNIGWTLAETQGNDSNGLFILPAGVGNLSDGETSRDDFLEEMALLWYEDEEWGFDWNQMSFNYYGDGTFDPDCGWSNNIYCSVRLVKPISSN